VVSGELGQVTAVPAHGVRGATGDPQVGEEVADRSSQWVLGGRADVGTAHRTQPVSPVASTDGCSSMSTCSALSEAQSREPSVVQNVGVSQLTPDPLG
jgi:hypothetical protein